VVEDELENVGPVRVVVRVVGEDVVVNVVAVVNVDDVGQPELPLACLPVYL